MDNLPDTNDQPNVNLFVMTKLVSLKDETKNNEIS